MRKGSDCQIFTPSHIFSVCACCLFNCFFKMWSYFSCRRPYVLPASRAAVSLISYASWMLCSASLLLRFLSMLTKRLSLSPAVIQSLLMVVCFLYS